MLDGIQSGDNIVWRSKRVDDYQTLAGPFAQSALEAGHPLVYFRFASHEPCCQKPAVCGSSGRT